MVCNFYTNWFFSAKRNRLAANILTKVLNENKTWPWQVLFTSPRATVLSGARSASINTGYRWKISSLTLIASASMTAWVKMVLFMFLLIFVENWNGHLNFFLNLKLLCNFFAMKMQYIPNYSLTKSVMVIFFVYKEHSFIILRRLVVIFKTM